MNEASYFPPDPSRVMPLMNNWEKCYHMERRGPLVQLAVVHAQFEIIHPFLDGFGSDSRPALLV
jgi:Fic family protein